MKFGQDGTFIVDNVTLEAMFSHPEVADRKKVAVSIIGAFRKGKSFLMDYALRFMYGHVSRLKLNSNKTLKKYLFKNSINQLPIPIIH